MARQSLSLKLDLRTFPIIRIGLPHNKLQDGNILDRPKLIYQWQITSDMRLKKNSSNSYPHMIVTIGFNYLIMREKMVMEIPCFLPQIPLTAITHNIL